jgi:hypothetical protein
MKRFGQTSIEAIVVGVVTVCIGALVYVTGVLEKVGLSNNAQMYAGLFLTGVLVHFGFEYLGGNKAYCKYYVGDKRAK